MLNPLFSCECNHGYSDTATDSAFSAHAGNCKQDGEWPPLVEKAFTDGIPDNIRKGIQVETTFGSLWPILPNNELCVSAGKKNWDRNVDGYITLFNSMILDKKDSYKEQGLSILRFLKIQLFLLLLEYREFLMKIKIELFFRFWATFSSQLFMFKKFLRIFKDF